MLTSDSTIYAVIYDLSQKLSKRFIMHFKLVQIMLTTLLEQTALKRYQFILNKFVLYFAFICAHISDVYI